MGELTRERPSDRRDLAWAVIIGALVLALFVLTLRADVGGSEDSPKFQFVGRVLGTAHSPGYPLYVVLTFLFGHLPIGNLALRINLFSALCAAASAAITFLIARALGPSRTLSAVAALSMATGTAFWHNAIVAEVYSLASALTGGVVLLLLRWDGSARRARLYAACAVFAAGLGNHLTIAGVLPAALAFGVARDRSVLSPRVMAIALIIGVAGLGQYGFVVARTMQHAPYLEARATTITGVADVMMANDQSYARFQYDARDLVAAQAPAFLAAVRREMTWPGVMLVAVGVLASVVRRDARLLFVAGAAVGMLGIVLNLSGDIGGFITPVMVLLWPLAAVGLDQLRRVAGLNSPWQSMPLAAAALLLPVAQVAANRSDVAALADTSDVQPLRALYASLPPGATVVADSFWTARVLDYLHFSSEYDPDPAPRVIAADADAARAAAAGGSPLFALSAAVPALESLGLAFRPHLLEASSMATVLRGLPRGTLVAAAAAGRALPIEWLPPRAAAVSGRPAAFGSLTWVVGTTSAKIRQSDASVHQAIHETAATPLTLDANDFGAVLRDGEGIVAAVDRGIVATAVSPQGNIIARWTFPATGTTNVRFDSTVQALAGEEVCATLREGEQSDVSAVLSGGGWVASLDYPGTSRILLRAAQSQHALRHRITIGHGTTAIENSGSETRLSMTQSGFGRSAFALSLAANVGRFHATLAPGSAARAVRVCRVAPPPIPETGSLNVGASDHRTFAGGWHEPERVNLVRVRWAEKSSTMLLPIETAAPLRIVLTISPAAGVTSVTAAMNEQPAGSCALVARWNDCPFSIPSSAVAAGVNRFTLTANGAAPGSPQDRRELAIAVQSALVRIGQ